VAASRAWRRSRCWRSDRLILQRQFVHQQDHLLFHAHHIVADEPAKITMEEIGRNRNAQAGRSADEGLADAAGHLQRIADATDHDGEEHLDQAEHCAEQAEQRRDQGDRAERVEKALEPVHDVTPGILDALLDDLAGALAHAERGGQQLTERRIIAQHFDMVRIELTRPRPLAYFAAEVGGNDGIAPQRPEPLEDDGQGHRRTEQDGHHGPAAGKQDF
jgi:hypothetical protein